MDYYWSLTFSDFIDLVTLNIGIQYSAPYLTWRGRCKVWSQIKRSLNWVIINVLLPAPLHKLITYLQGVDMKLLRDKD